MNRTPPPSAEAVPALELEAVSVPSPVDPDRGVVREVSWRVEEGETWLIAGSAGSGKSSLLGVAAGLVRPLRGRHRLFGVDLATLSESGRVARRVRIGLVFGGGGRLLPGWSLIENLTLPERYHERRSDHEVAARVEGLMGAFGLERFATWTCRELPRRIAQRAALARALMLRPEVLLFDDPLFGAVPDEIEWWMTVAQPTAREAGVRTMVMACQDPRPWVTQADRFACLRGREWRELSGAAEIEPLLRLSSGD